MTRRKMAKAISELLGTDEIQGTKHIDRPTGWLRKIIKEADVLKINMLHHRNSAEDTELEREILIGLGRILK